VTSMFGRKRLRNPQCCYKSSGDHEMYVFSQVFFLKSLAWLLFNISLALNSVYSTHTYTHIHTHTHTHTHTHIHTHAHTYTHMHTRIRPIVSSFDLPPSLGGGIVRGPDGPGPVAGCGIVSGWTGPGSMAQHASSVP
jgi:hypothetical protein